MKSVLMTIGMFLMMCGGDFLHVGSRVAGSFHMTSIPDAATYIVVVIGAGCIIECANRTSPA
jgi:hypothetical protein